MRIGTGSGPWLVSEDIETNDQTGSERVQVWEGSQAECQSQRSIALADGASRVKIGPKGDGNYSLRVSYPYGDTKTDDPVDQMELETNVVMKSAYQSPEYMAQFSDYSAGYSAKGVASIAPVSEMVKIWQTDKVLTSATYTTKQSAALAQLGIRLTANGVTDAGDRALAGYLFQNIAWRGVTSFLQYQQVFRRTVTAGSPLAVTANFTGAGQIWTSAEVVAFEGIPSDGWFNLPSGVQWLKDKPRVSKVWGRKTQLTYSYTEIETACRLFYSAYGSASLIWA